MSEVREQPAIAFPRISREVLDVLMEELKRRDSFKAAANFAIAQPYVLEYVLTDINSAEEEAAVREAAVRLTAMEFFCRALQLQMQRGV